VRSLQKSRTHLILRLLERKLLQTVLPVRCPSCRSNLRITPEDLSTEIRCSFCDHDFPLALAIAWAGPKRSDWLYRVAGHVPHSRLQSALPVLAATSVLASLTQGGFDTQPQTPGLEIVGPDRRAELDIATVVDTFRPVVVLGEVKSHQPMTRTTSRT
jgi:LSD1 subclass zinc finger protein